MEESAREDDDNREKIKKLSKGRQLGLGGENTLLTTLAQTIKPCCLPAMLQFLDKENKMQTPVISTKKCLSPPSLHGGHFLGVTQSKIKGIFLFLEMPLVYRTLFPI